MSRPRIPDGTLLRFAANIGADAQAPQAAPELTVDRAAAYVLSLDWDKKCVTHGTLAACVPPHERQAELLAHALRYFADECNWLHIGSVVIRAHNQKRLRDYAVKGWPYATLRDLVNVRQALVILDALPVPDDRGLRALQLRERDYLASLAR
jgi:hypothetical protein